ncbi:50S ribosomal protein L13 [bacterium]|nr:50S ribosomal protein L13 [bacterium]
MTTYMAKAADKASRQWWVVDAAKTDLSLGRMATRIAKILMGKHKPTYTPHLDTGDFVIVVNAEKVKVTGKKRLEKVYPYFTLYPSGLRARTFADLVVRDPGKIIRFAVSRMLPKSKLGRTQISKLKSYKGPAHPHAAQKPEPIDISKI